MLDQLEGWIAYYHHGGVGGMNNHWRQLNSTAFASDNPQGGGVYASLQQAHPATDAAETAVESPIEVRRVPSLSTESHYERAVFDHRPMLEDGTIDYEFFYREGRLTVHPAIDRLCLLMDPDGVKVHWLTDGMHDRSNLSPGNEIVEPNNRRGESQLPLLNNAWNHVSLSLKGDVIELTLNDRLIYQRPLEATNQRRFGFYHDANRSEVRVRHVVWRGQWGTTLPAVAEQDLADDNTDMLDRDVAHMKATFHHNFAEQDLTSNRIAIQEGVLDENIIATPNGIKATLRGSGGYRNAKIAPRLSIHGDFAATVAYEDFESDPVEGGHSTLILIANMKSRDHAFVTRRHMSSAAGLHENIVQCCLVEVKPQGERRDYFVTQPMEERSGRLRLSRRGNKIYYLSAEGDSPNFRLWGSREFSAEPIPAEGLVLLAQVHPKGSFVSVVWKNIDVRAERVLGLATGKADDRLATLDAEKDKLPVKAVFDFSKQQPDSRTFYVWGKRVPWQPNPLGLAIEAVGADDWTSAGVNTRQVISGDFDISAEVSGLQLATPKMEKVTQLYLQLIADNPDQTQASSIFEVRDSGATKTVAQLRTRKVEGGFEYVSTGGFVTRSVSSLRVARRGRTITMLAKPAGSDIEQILWSTEFTDQPLRTVSSRLYVFAHNNLRIILT